MSRFEALELAARLAKERQDRLEHAARQFLADCRWALADYLGVPEEAVRVQGDGANGDALHWDGGEVRTHLVLAVGGTEFRFPVRFRPDPAEAHHTAAVAGGEYVEYALHDGIWRLTGAVHDFIRQYFEACRYVEPVVTASRVTLPPDERPTAPAQGA
jgi:hypothetical protein